MKNLFKDKKFLYTILFLILGVLIGLGSYFGINTYFDYKAEKAIEDLNIVLDNGIESKDICSFILDFDETKTENNKFFNKSKFDLMHANCDLKFNLNYIELNEENCTDIIKQNKEYFLENYLIVDNFLEQKTECIEKFLVVKFSTGALYDVENDFKSEINLDFSLDFYTDIGEEDSEEYLNNRIETKKRLLDLIVINPKVDFSVDDIILYPKKGILRLPLKTLTEYKISLKNFNTSIGEETKNKEFVFTTPENKYFGLRILDRVSLYKDNKPPRFQLLEYNTTKTKAKVKICRIPNETYAKIEIFRKNAETTEVNDFFLNKIDKLQNFECSEKEIDFSLLKNNHDKNNISLIKKDFNFDDLIGEVSRSGLYFVEFSESNDRNYYNKISYPIFFGIVDSHITMKISRNGEAFFFVNDFEGKPLAKQNIKLYLNDFKGVEKEWNNSKEDYDIKKFSALDKNIFSEAIYLGLTGGDGILKVNLKDKVSDAFSRTFTETWEYDWNEIYRTFFITSASDTNISYVNSTWNSGIAPWNFGYKINEPNFWGNNSTNQNQDELILDKWGEIEPTYYSHTYTDRLLYLPGETVNIKSVIRKSSDLSIPKGKKVLLKISDSGGTEIYNKEIEINDFGSISDNFALKDTLALGNYNINLTIDGEFISYGGFSVEVFKNPKFKNEILLETEGLNEGLVKIEKEEVKKYDYRDETIYKGNFKIKGKVFSKYYNGAAVANTDFTYKVYKQYYYESTYWDGCYYGCYWEPNKEFYTEGKGMLDSNGVGIFDIDVEFSSNYSDYKYIVEVTVTDKVGDTISGANSVIAKLPNDYKGYNNDLSVLFKSEEKFIKVGEKITIDGGLNVGKWTTDYNDKYLFIIKKKEYKNTQVDDVRGYKRNVTKISEKPEKILLVNNENFSMTSDGKLKLNYQLNDVGEYVFEYGKIENTKNIDIKSLIEEFNKNKISEKEIDVEKEIEICEKEIPLPKETSLPKEIPLPGIPSPLQEKEATSAKKCKIVKKTEKENIKLSDLYTDKMFFNILTYGKTNAQNPIVNDNKIKVIPEKISYNLGEKAKVLIRLPFSKGKILWTIEKQGVIKSEYIDVKSNIFFKEINIDNTFIPNAYIGVVAIEVDGSKVPEYKVGYSEIVVDKTDKKSFITIKADKKTYKPREKVSLDIQVKDKKGKANKSELTVMVVDDSLISLLGNVDLNTLEKFYKKLPFQIQTSITNIAMLRNYYFSRPGIVGGSGFGNFKGGDSAVSSRNIFKNTAYYNPSVLTDNNGNAKVSFNLPDNLTNFRVMVISNSKNNLFGYSEHFIEVRQNVIIEDKTPLILRDSDVSLIGANIFNNTDKEIGFDVKLTASVEVAVPNKKVTIPAGTSKYVSWGIKANSLNKKITYKISALGDSVENSDKIENTINFKESPILINNVIKSAVIDGKETHIFNVNIPDNTDLEKSEVEINISNNNLNGIEKIVSSLAQYPYGCIEQTTSSTLPNAILKNFDKLFSGVITDKTIIDTNINVGIDRIKSMQTTDGGFAYWEGSNESDLHITPYVVRSLLQISDFGTKLPNGLLDKALTYLEKEFENKDISDLEKAEIFWALTKAGKDVSLDLNANILDRHTLIAYTYGLVLSNKDNKNKKNIDNNIVLIKEKLKDNNEYNRYWDDLSDKAIYVSLLIDYEASRDYIDQIIGELYDYDWSSYFYSTQSKNNAFIAFAKYIEKYSKENHSKFSFSLGSYNTKSLLEVGDTFPNMYKQNFKLSDILNNKPNFEFKVSNLMGDRLYVNIVLKAFPKDKTKIASYSNGIKIERVIYEVIDENNLEQCSNNYYYGAKTIDCNKVLKKVAGNIYKKGTLYKSQLNIAFTDKKDRRNLVVEDYLPGAFRIINSKFKTEQIGVQNATSQGRNWDHIEFRPDVVMANASYVWSGGSSFEYFFIPEFEGKYTQPPAVTYIMYNPQIRANTGFNIIDVK